MPATLPYTAEVPLYVPLYSCPFQLLRTLPHNWRRRLAPSFCRHAGQTRSPPRLARTASSRKFLRMPFSWHFLCRKKPFRSNGCSGYGPAGHCHACRCGSGSTVLRDALAVASGLPEAAAPPASSTPPDVAPTTAADQDICVCDRFFRPRGVCYLFAGAGPSPVGLSLAMGCFFTSWFVALSSKVERLDAEMTDAELLALALLAEAGAFFPTLVRVR